MSDRSSPRYERLVFAVRAFSKYGTPNRLAQAVEDCGWEQIRAQLGSDSPGPHVEPLYAMGVDVVFRGGDCYPLQLNHLRRPPGLLFTWGNRDLLRATSVSMCGSRHVSERGLEAAAACGLEVATCGLTIVSGYASGVDTATHLAALRSGGSTVIVLAEGILGFRKKRVFHDVPFDEEHVVVVSQFAPGQHWNVGAAMTRNGVIVSLGKALVVIEAGETGGTLNAGLQALELGRAVLALEFSSQPTPAGNQLLIEKGAVPIQTRQQLGRVVKSIQEMRTKRPALEQLRLA